MGCTIMAAAESYAVEQLRHIVEVKSLTIRRLLERPEQTEVSALRTQLEVYLPVLPGLPSRICRPLCYDAGPSRPFTLDPHDPTK